MEHIRLIEIVVEAKAGAKIDDCIADAVVTAMHNDGTVKLTHNGSVFVITSADIRRMILNTEVSQ